jgi:hypothetical protein
VDNVLRSNGTAPGEPDANRAEVERIFEHGLKNGVMASQDKMYLAQLVSARTGISPEEAETRVSTAYSEAQAAADQTRKAVAHFSLWLFVALLSGAFSASYAGTIGGKQRDHVAVS